MVVMVVVMVVVLMVLGGGDSGGDGGGDGGDDDGGVDGYCDGGDCSPVPRSQLVVVHRNGCGPLPQFCGNPQLQDQVCTENCQVSRMLSALCSVKC